MLLLSTFTLLLLYTAYVELCTEDDNIPWNVVRAHGTLGPSSPVAWMDRGAGSSSWLPSDDLADH